MLIQSTTLPMTENRIKETIKGHKEVWTAKKGDINILKSTNIREVRRYGNKL